MLADPFRPLDTRLDGDRALAILRGATNGAEDGELFLERRRSEVIMLDDGRIRTASYDASEGFGLRAVKGEVTGFAHSSEFSEANLPSASRLTLDSANALILRNKLIWKILINNIMSFPYANIRST